MRGGLERWKRGSDSHGVCQAMAYAFKATCDSHRSAAAGVDALAGYGAGPTVTRFVVEQGRISSDQLHAAQLRVWVDGSDPTTGERRGRELMSPDADLVLDGTINAPKSYSIAALLDEDLSAEFEALHDRLRDQIITTWQRELNARRGAGGRVRESIQRVEVVELQHRRSRALDPHIHRHLWLNVRVLGEDGQWSNVDSRVAMRLHTVINAEGDLAARTDPAWLAALARHGYSLNKSGEIAELAHLVRPVSRRSNQIEANRAALLAQWRADHAGEQPSYGVLHQIDRRAWATGRPNKPDAIDEETWQQMVLHELASVDSRVTDRRATRVIRSVPVGSLDRDLLAAMAVVDADDRSTSSSGRFSRFDLRAGAIRAISQSGVVAHRELLDDVIADVTGRAIRTVVSLLPAEEEVPDHVKALIAPTTVRLKVRLANHLDRLAAPGTPVSAATIHKVARQLHAPDLEAAQAAAVGAIAGTDRLVTVTGPAGTGKTTMLRVANRLIQQQGGRMIVVAPTKKAATVAAREIATAASSLHALLHDHGYRWHRDASGAQKWLRLTAGEADPTTGIPYDGPTRHVLTSADRIVVDEAGMVDLHTATALTELALETGASIALVGDPFQALPVGHAGAMAAATRRATTTIELTSVHRFEDPAYAALTLRLRNPGDHTRALQVAADLEATGHVRRVDNADAARDAMIQEYFHWSSRGSRVCLVTGSNAEADAINEAIQLRRIEEGRLDPRAAATGHDGQQLLVGDTVQTRRNDRAAGVENRATWIIRAIHHDTIDLMSPTDSSDIRRVPLTYAAEHIHLAYASTVHGIQGETSDASIVGPDVDAAGLYVGLTRGRDHNLVLTVAGTDATSRNLLADCMLRGSPELNLTDSVEAARAEHRRAAHPNEATPLTAPSTLSSRIGM